MAAGDITLKRGTVQTLTIADSIANGAAASSDSFGPATDVAQSPVEFRLVVTATSTAQAAGEAINVYVADGTEAGAYDGGIAESSAVTNINALKNVNFAISLIGDGVSTVLQRSCVISTAAANAVVIIENTATNALTATTATVQPLNYAAES